MSEHDVMTCGALIVGAGPAGLGCALHLQKLINAHNEAIEKGEKQGAPINEETLGVDAVVMVIEKAGAVGAHAISGAVMNPNALSELMPDFKEKGAPLEFPAENDNVLQLTAKAARKLPIIPPTMHNHGNYIVSLNKLVKWMGDQFAELGQDVYATFSGQEMLIENGAVQGVRCGDKGVNPDGTPKSNFEAGMDLHAKATVLCDGSRGNLTKKLVKELKLDEGKNPQVYATGVKEIWELPEGRLTGGTVIHTMGYPCDAKTFGGGFIYNMTNNQVSVGMITALDAKDPQIDPHKQFCKYKNHPYVQKILEGGKMLFYGAKTLPEGGWNSVPKLAGQGFMICGDAACLINVPKLKGINYAIKSGMIAAETIFDAMASGTWDAAQFEKYATGIEQSWIGQELIPFKNFRPLMKKGIFPWGMVKGGINYFTKGRYPWIPIMKLEEDCTELKPMAEYYPGGVKPDDGIKFDNKELLYDKLTDVYNSGATHEEKQPCHLHVDADKCKKCYEVYGAPCEAFCPAQVYNIVKDEKTGEFQRIQVDFSNCVHCKTCDIRDPMEAITWVCPEGGGGPQYNNL
jgi:electron-transferring-flavoprotein dehydrogenase